MTVLSFVKSDGTFVKITGNKKGKTKSSKQKVHCPLKCH
ncbi:hypothetical protein B4143_0060 [Bacillus subtilis]|nr:hypothetical protein B4143_0060 [Bacillus subtilis]